MGHVGSKTRSPGQILENSCLHSRGHIFNPILMKLCQNVVLIIYRPSLNMGHVGSKTRSLGQILGYSCLHSRAHFCDPILIKLCQNVWLDNIQAKFGYGSRWFKNQVTRSNLRKFLCTLQRPHLPPDFDETLVRMFVLTISTGYNQSVKGCGSQRRHVVVTQRKLI